ncbi:MAG TPA: exodeoxyribonuclease III [Candidatus Syntrophosphaera sp.]|nr:exodeoxyribonuclease III [Candidatus Syntrophosphaera sp.]
MARNNTELTLWSWNVNGLRAVLNKDFIATIQREQPDWLGLQETKLQEHQIPSELEALINYRFYWSHAARKGYSGTAVLSRPVPLQVDYGFGNPEFDSEGRIVRCEYKHLIIYNIYFPNGQLGDERLDYKLRFYDRCLERMQEDRASGKMVLVTGDYNTAHKEIDLANPKENEKTSGFLPIERAWLDKIVEHDWVDTFRLFHPEPQRYSWWSYRAGARPRNVGWRIDYFFVDAGHQGQVLDADIRDDILGSDHCPVTLRIRLP